MTKIASHETDDYGKLLEWLKAYETYNVKDISLSTTYVSDEPKGVLYTVIVAYE